MVYGLPLAAIPIALLFFLHLFFGYFIVTRNDEIVKQSQYKQNHYSAEYFKG